VQLFSYTYKCKLICLRIVWLIVFVFAANSIIAQNDTVKTGTIPIEDTVYDELIETAPAVEELEDLVENKQVHFKSKWMEGAGMDSIRLRHLPDSVLKALKSHEDFMYAKRKEDEKAIEPPAGENGNKATSRQFDPPPKRMSQAGWFQSLLWIVIIGGFIAFLIIWLAGSDVRIFGKKRKRVTGETEEEITEDIFAINYQKEIDKAAANGNYRFAIRLMFLRLLKTMSERNIIRYKQDSTNLDYLLQLSNSNHYNDFFRITRNYEYSWYGQFEVKEDAFKVIRNDFDNLDRKMR
jgi:hypothetical protein